MPLVYNPCFILCRHGNRHPGKCGFAGRSPELGPVMDYASHQVWKHPEDSWVDLQVIAPLESNWGLFPGSSITPSEKDKRKKDPTSNPCPSVESARASVMGVGGWERRSLNWWRRWGARPSLPVLPWPTRGGMLQLEMCICWPVLSERRGFWIWDVGCTLESAQAASLSTVLSPAGRMYRWALGWVAWISTLTYLRL